jgi:hypothetical protein
MKLPRWVLALTLVGWIFVILYPDPAVLVHSVRDILHPAIDPGAVRDLARHLPNDPRVIESVVANKLVPYSYDWQTNGVPWYFPSARDVVRERRGDCESRAILLASILTAKGIPNHLRMSFDHIWVDYPGKRANALENSGVMLAERRHGHFVFHWPRNFNLAQEVSDQVAIYWTPAPPARKALLLAGFLVIPLFNGIAAALRRLIGAGGAPLDAERPRRRRLKRSPRRRRPGLVGRPMRV